MQQANHSSSMDMTKEKSAKAVLHSLHIVKDVSEREVLLKRLVAIREPTVISFLNAHALNLAWNDTVFLKNLLRSSLVLRDGIGVAACLSVLGMQQGINMNGTDFIPMLISAYARKRIALFGTVEPYLTKATQTLVRLGCSVVATMDGFQQPEKYADILTHTPADLVILGMGMPKQEAVACMLAARLRYPVLIVSGGAILDFWGERFPRAPLLVQNLHMEWVFRLYLEPKRLWKRYIFGGAVFALRTLQLKFSQALSA